MRALKIGLNLANGIRPRLLAVTMLAIAPLFGFRLMEINAEHDQLVQDAREHVVQVAMAGAYEQSGLIDDAQNLLEMVPRLPGAANAQSPVCIRTLRQLGTGYGWIQSLTILDRDLNVVCADREIALGHSFAELPHVKAAVNRKQFMVSEITSRRKAGKARLAAAMPLLAPAGDTLSVVAVTISSTWLNESIQQSADRAQGIAVIADKNGNIVARHSYDPTVEVDAGLGRVLQENAKLSPYPWFNYTKADNQDFLFGFSGVPGTTSRLFVGVPLTEISNKIEAQRQAAYFVLGITTLLVLAICWLGGEFLFVRPIRNLAQTAGDIADGSTGTRAAIPAGPTELRTLANSFNTMVERLEDLANVDGMTGLANRRYLDARLKEIWSNRALREQPIGIAMIDVDHFKAYNDHYEHLGGDACLREVADIIKEHAKRAGDLAARYGGEEFCLVVQGDNAQKVADHCEVLRLAIWQRGMRQSPKVGGNVTVSIGVAYATPSDAEAPEDLIASADRALYDAKSGGRNRVVMAGSNGNILLLAG